MLTSERIFKIKVRLGWTVSEIFAYINIYLYLKSFAWKLSNIFKTTNVTNFTKAILKSSYRALQVTFKQKTLKELVYFLKAVEFCSTFWHSNWHNFGYILRKVVKPHFLEISNDYCQKCDGFRVFLGSSTTSQVFLIYTFLTKKQRPF